MFGTTGDASANKFVIGSETNNTTFEFKKGLGVQPIKLDGGTLLMRIDPNGGMEVVGGATFAGAVSSDAGYRISSSAINAQTGTTYSLLSTDNGEILTFNNGSAVTVTIPTGLPVGFNCTVIQLGAGQVGFTAAAGVTLNSYGGVLKLAGQHGAATIISYSSDVYNIAGTLST
jgi:hypothetical protein